ncbi:MAG: riboflavin synthase [Dehalococcoidia bacterium]
MFTGIVEEVGVARAIEDGTLSFSGQRALEDMAVGDSIAVNGACLTITSLNDEVFAVNVMPETLRRTNLTELKVGELVNLERPLILGGRLGGHLMQGHVDGTAHVLSVEPEGDAMIMEIECPSDLTPYIVSKGFIGVDGVSLTVVERRDRSFTVSLVLYTWEHTTLSHRKPGSLVNLEVDVIAKYLEQLVKSGDSRMALNLPARESGVDG